MPPVSLPPYSAVPDTLKQLLDVFPKMSPQPWKLHQRLSEFCPRVTSVDCALSFCSILLWLILTKYSVDSEVELNKFEMDCGTILFQTSNFSCTYNWKIRFGTLKSSKFELGLKIFQIRLRLIFEFEQFQCNKTCTFRITAQLTSSALTDIHFKSKFVFFHWFV